MSTMNQHSVEFYVSDQGRKEPEVLVRFTDDGRGLFTERFDRLGGHCMVAGTRASR